MTLTITPYTRPNKFLAPVDINLVFPNFNAYGREVGSIEVNLADQVTCFRRAVFEKLHYLKQCRAQGYEHKVKEHEWELNFKIKQYKKYWSKYLKAKKGEF